MSIAILGSGNMARGLAGLFANAGYEVILGSRDPSKAQAAVASLGARVRAADVKTAAASSDLVVLAVPFDAAAATIAVAGGLAGKTLIDITNPLTADYQGLTIGHTTSAAEEIQKLAPQAKVVKAFNTLFAQVLQSGGKVGGVASSVFIAGDDEAANKSVEAVAQGRHGAGPDRRTRVGALSRAARRPQHRARLRPRTGNRHRADLEFRREDGVTIAGAVSGPL